MTFMWSLRHVIKFRSLITWYIILNFVSNISSHKLFVINKYSNLLTFIWNLKLQNYLDFREFINLILLYCKTIFPYLSPEPIRAQPTTCCCTGANPLDKRSPSTTAAPWPNANAASAARCTRVAGETASSTHGLRMRRSWSCQRESDSGSGVIVTFSGWSCRWVLHFKF